MSFLQKEKIAVNCTWICDIMIVVKKGDRDIVFFCGFLAALTAFLTTHRPSLNDGGGVFLPPLLGDIMARTTIELTEDKHILCSIAVAAVNLGIARVTLDQWIKDHKFPKNGTKVDFTELLKVRRETVEQQKKDVSDAERKTKAEADLKEKNCRKTRNMPILLRSPFLRRI